MRTRRPGPVALGGAAVLALGGPALAHGGGVPVTPADLWTHWSLDPWSWGPLLVLHWLYGRGLLRLWARAGRFRGIAGGRVGCFLLGEAALFAALISPLHELGETLQSAHMAQHALLILIAPPLLLAGRPGVAMAHALPPPMARAVGRSVPARALRRLGRPLPAAGLHAAALWLWHAPPFYDLALQSPWLHWLEHAVFLGTAMLLWRAVLAGPAPAAFAAAAVTLLQSGLLGALLSLSPRLLYDWYEGRTLAWGVSALEDQQLAGALMWAPMGFGYLAACLYAAARFLRAGEPLASSLVEARGSGSVP